MDLNHTNSTVNAALAPIDPHVTPSPFLGYQMREQLKSEGGELFWEHTNDERTRIRGAEMHCIAKFAESLEDNPTQHPPFAEFVRQTTCLQAQLLRDKYGPHKPGGVDNYSGLWSPDGGGDDDDDE
jgi:hypothetical protein